MPGSWQPGNAAWGEAAAAPVEKTAGEVPAFSLPLTNSVIYCGFRVIHYGMIVIYCGFRVSYYGMIVLYYGCMKKYHGRAMSSRPSAYSSIFGPNLLKLTYRAPVEKTAGEVPVSS